MRKNRRRWLAQFGLAMSMGAALLPAGAAWSQEPPAPPPPPQPSARAAEEAEEAAPSAAQNEDAAEEATHQQRPATQDAARQTQPRAPQPVGQAQEATRDAAQQPIQGARQTIPGAQESVRGYRDAGVDARARAQTDIRVEDLRSADLGMWFARSQARGLTIADVAAGSAMSRFGFQEGDVIVSVAGRPVRSEAVFLNYLLAPEARHEPVEVVVMRNGREEVIVVEPAGLIEEIAAVEVDPLEEFGIVLDDRYDDRLLVWKVIRRSPAYYGGIRPGDVIVAVNNQRVNAERELAQLIARAAPGPVTVEVMRNDRARRIEVDAPRIEVRETVDPSLPPVGPNVRVEERDAPDVETRIETHKVVPVPTPAPVIVPAPQNPPAVTPQPRRGLRPILPRRQP